MIINPSQVLGYKHKTRHKSDILLCIAIFIEELRVGKIREKSVIFVTIPKKKIKHIKIRSCDIP